MTLLTPWETVVAVTRRSANVLHEILALAHNPDREMRAKGGGSIPGSGWWYYADKRGIQIGTRFNMATPDVGRITWKQAVAEIRARIDLTPHIARQQRFLEAHYAHGAATDAALYARWQRQPNVDVLEAEDRRLNAIAYAASSAAWQPLRDAIEQAATLPEDLFDLLEGTV